MGDLFTEITWTNYLSPLGNEAHVYACDIETLDIKNMLPLLTKEELAKAHAFRQLPDTNRFIMGRLIAKKLLGFYGMTEASDIIIYSGINGKPLARTEADASLPLFNISHSGSKVLIACCNQMVGVDVEKITGTEMESVAAAVFSKRELYLFSTSDDVVRTFYNFWTRKEALLKAVGVGLIDDLPSIDISQKADADFVNTFTPKELELLSFTMNDNERYFASLCYVKDTATRFITMTNEMLIQL